MSSDAARNAHLGGCTHTCLTHTHSETPTWSHCRKMTSEKHSVDFSEPWTYSDIIFIVEGKKVSRTHTTHTHALRYHLCSRGEKVRPHAHHTHTHCRLPVCPSVCLVCVCACLSVCLSVRQGVHSSHSHTETLVTTNKPSHSSGAHVPLSHT